MHRLSLAMILTAVAVCAAGLPARAQVETSEPIHVKTLKPKKLKFRGTVVSVTPASIIVRDRQNQLALRTFTYSDAVRDQMAKVLERGGYQFGDRVDIEYAAGTDVALRIKGKPSKPL